MQKITFCSGVGSVTGANFLVETGNKKFLVDCGLIQGERVAKAENRDPFSYDPSQIDYLFVTHAHLDHVGRIPKLVKEGFKGLIYSTPETKALAEIVLTDAVGILDMEARQEGILSLYDAEDVSNVWPIWRTVPYHEKVILDGISVTFKDAGHILGSSMISIHVTDETGKVTKYLFSGDLGNSPSPLLRDTEVIGEADYVIMESTYGDRNHEPKELRVQKLQEIVNDTLKKGGTLVIPAFSIDRTQVMLYELNNMVEKGLIPSVPVFVDSPMAIKATDLYSKNISLFNDAVQNQIKNGDDIFSFPKLQFTVSQDESRDIEKVRGAKIILAGSGMSIGGRVIKHEEAYLPDAKNTIMLPGYQSLGSLGRHLSDGDKKVEIYGRTIKVRARVEKLDGFSAHKDSDNLLQFVSTGMPHIKKVFVVMGEPKSAMHLAQRINDELGIPAVFPEKDKEYEII